MHDTVRMRRGIVFATDVLDAVVELAAEAEEHGFARVWTTEYPGRDGIARALAIALRTSRIEVGTGVAYAFARLPLAMAALASDVQKLSNGRFGLGLSPGTKGVRRWFGADFEPPAPTLTAYVDTLRELWADTSVYASPAPPIYLAAFNPIMTRHAAGSADGLLLHPLAAGAVHLNERVLPAVQRGAEGRDAPPELVAWRVVSLDDDEERARERAAAQLAFYFSTPSYATAVEGTEWEAVPERIRDAFQAQKPAPDWIDIGRLVPDSMIDEFTLAGTAASVRRRLPEVERVLRDAGVSELVFQTVGAGIGDDEVVQNCRRIIRDITTAAEEEPA
jgi:alkanesulfonate monooxygenase SsuD/methylene tetrahydromethanopterin reductase-like flavin-dependent oxidoreductase (luciferase family)